MTTEAFLKEILKLPVADRLLLVETIWDSIAATPEQIPIPAWHREELDRRLAEKTPKHLTWEQVQARLRQAS